MTIRDALIAAQSILQKNSIEEPLKEARRLLALSPVLPLEQQLKTPDKPLTSEEESLFFSLVKRRADGEPFAYLAGVSEFFGRPFLVGPGVLIPRPETEQLVAWWLEKILSLKDKGDLGNSLTLLDIGTGSGCIGITLALELEARGIVIEGLCLTDISREALSYAKKNLAALQVSCPVMLEETDLLPEVWPSADLVFSNPPYIDVANDPALENSVLTFEPRLALDGGAAGMVVYQKLALRLNEVADGPFYLGLEHGYRQADQVKQVFQASRFDVISSMTDYNGYERGQWLVWHK